MSEYIDRAAEERRIERIEFFDPDKADAERRYLRRRLIAQSMRPAEECEVAPIKEAA